jgi:hypothetical protein
MQSAQFMDIFNIFSQKPHVPMDIFVATFDDLPASSENSLLRYNRVRYSSAKKIFFPDSQHFCQDG